MDALSFCFWVHGFDEISGGVVPNATQWAIIQDHLKLVIPPTRNPSGGYPAPVSINSPLNVTIGRAADGGILYC